MRRAHQNRYYAMAAILIAFASASPASATNEEFVEPDWDQVANIKDAAKRIAEFHRRSGANRTVIFINDCYKTHSLSSRYTKALEACITQDYLETQILAIVYSRPPPEVLEKIGAPSPQALADAMGRRMAAAFSSYKVPVAYAKQFKELVDEHGFPLFFKTLFPKAKVPPTVRPNPPEQE